jgi:hypothetical protein
VTCERSDLEGAIVLVGITRKHKDGSISQEQHSGVASVRHYENMSVVDVHCDDGISRNYPFDVRTLEVARPGEYRLRSTGTAVVDPHYLMTWIVEEALDS